MTKSFDDPSVLAQSRQLYKDGVPVAAILEQTGLTVGRFYYWLDRPLPGEAVSPNAVASRRKEVLSLSGKASAVRRATVMARLWRAAERHVVEIEERLARLDLEPAPEAADDVIGRDARTLAVLARVVRELSSAEAVTTGGGRPKSTSRTPETHDDAPPRNIDEFRKELARRLQRLRDERGNARPSGNAQRG